MLFKLILHGVPFIAVSNLGPQKAMVSDVFRGISYDAETNSHILP
jgi:hypothetical protein